jgi:hypothetical protein
VFVLPGSQFGFYDIQTEKHTEHDSFSELVDSAPYWMATEWRGLLYAVDN